MAIQISISNSIGSRDVVSSGGIDPDAQAFITAASITNPTQQAAINTLVVDLKGYSIWTKFKAIYPIVGGTASQHKFNLKDPRDLDAAFRLTFATGWTHSANGMLPNGATYADTFLNTSIQLNVNSHSFGMYSRTNNTTGSQAIGSFDNTPRFLQNNLSLGNFVSGLVSSVISYTANPSTSLLMLTRTSSTLSKAFRAGVLLGQETVIMGTLPTFNFYLGARNNAGTPVLYSNHQCAFAFLGDGLTDTEAGNLYTAVQAYQTTLGREMIENQQLELDAGNTNSYPGTGTTWTDLTGNSRNGTLINGVGFSSLNSGSLTFDGTNDYVNVAGLSTVLSNVQNFSYNAWFKANVTSGNYTLFSFGGESNNFGNDVLVIIGNNAIAAQINNGGDGSGFISFTSTNWNNIQVVYDGSLSGNSNRLKIYLNGVLQTLSFSSGYTVPAFTSNTGLTSNIGRYTANNLLFFNGNISTTSIYTISLTQAQVTQNFNAIKSRYGL